MQHETDTRIEWLRRGMGAALLLVAAAAAPAAAQEDDLAARCRAASQSQTVQERCLLVVQALEIAQPRLGVALAGGNPVPGTASTLGMRLGTLPRISLGARVTGVWVELPDVLAPDADESIEFVAPAVHIDAAVGLFSGFSPAPTVGGLGSVDLIGSAGVVPIPDENGFRDDSPFSWAAGVRVGLLRESFTMPGVSVTGMYRRMDDVAFGDSTLTTDPAYFQTDLSMLSVRAAVSKRLFLIGLTAGVGYDKISSDIDVRARGGNTTVQFTTEDFENDAFEVFGNLSFTILVFNAVAELGWMKGADAVEGVPTQVPVDPEDGTLFGSFAIRIAI